jgi:phosphoesterase RecJ-like protein
MNPEDITTVKSLLSQPQKIAIIPHKNPDGDAMGAALAVYAFLKDKGHEANVISPNDYPKFLKWMPGNDDVVNFERENQKAQQLIQEADLIFTLDFNDMSRVGQMETALKEASADFIMIDHHQQPGDYAKVTYSDVSMSSTCEMVYNFIDFLGDRYYDGYRLFQISVHIEQNASRGRRID